MPTLTHPIRIAAATLTILSAALVAGLTGCDQTDQRLIEKARLEGREAAREQIEAENERARQMEADLERRHRFFEALTGIYEGEIRLSDGSVNRARVSFSPSLPRYPRSDRVRTIDELSYEINNLYLNAQVVTWSKLADTEGRGSELAFGCVFEQVRPDLAQGRMHLVSENCKHTYTLYLSELDAGTGEIVRADYPIDASSAIASQVGTGQIRSVEGLVGHKQSNLSSTLFELSVRKADGWQ